MEDSCSLHECINDLTTQINEDIRVHHTAGWLKYWVGADSYFDKLYFDKVEEYSYRPLTDQEEVFIKRKGVNLERIIDRWLNANPTISLEDIETSVEAYILKQFKKADLKDLFDDCSCE
jgi:hypothetical protein